MRRSSVDCYSQKTVFTQKERSSERSSVWYLEQFTALLIMIFCLDYTQKLYEMSNVQFSMYQNFSVLYDFILLLKVKASLVEKRK